MFLYAFWVTVGGISLSYLWRVGKKKGPGESKRGSTDDYASLMGYAKVKQEMSTVEDGGYEMM